MVNLSAYTISYVNKPDVVHRIKMKKYSLLLLILM